MSILNLPPGMSFRTALQFGYAGRMTEERYTRWVKQLPCCGCGAPADDPHHPKLEGFAVAASKVPDFWCIPLCRPCHDALHRDVTAWERSYGEQWAHVVMTLTRALWCGILVFK
ncbi:MAG: DUF968 domain-containing protein [Tepidisphaeraceae bacterium]